MTAGDLHDALAKRGADLLHRALAALEHGALHFTPQTEAGATYATKIDKAEAKIDWSRPAQDVHNHIRGLSPFPGAWFEYKGERIKVLHSSLAEGEDVPGSTLDDKLTIACRKNAIRLISLQRPGKLAMGAEEFLRGFPVPKSSMLK